MTTKKLDSLADQGREALQDFLKTLLGSDVSLDIEATVARADAEDVTGQRIVQAGNFCLLLDDGWIPLLSNAMLGEPLAADDEGAGDLLSEMTSQGHGALRTHFAGLDVDLPETTFAVLPPGSPLPEDISVTHRLDVRVSIEGEELQSRVLFSFPMEAPDLPEEEQEPPLGQSEAEQKAPLEQAQAEQERPFEPPAAELTPSHEDASGAGVARADFNEIGPERIMGDGGNNSFELLAEVELEITVELGRRRLPLADVLRLTTGSVIELEKLVGEPLDIYANGRLIAEGEAVVIDEQFGVRITSLASKTKRSKAFF